MTTPIQPVKSSDRRPVLSKRDFVRRYAAGEFGNASPTWDGYWEWIDDLPWQRYGNLYHIRNRVKGGRTWYDVNYWYMLDRWEEALGLYKPGDLYISAMAPTALTLFQGEVQRGLWGSDLTYTTVAKPMRNALAQQTRIACGIIARTLLQTYLCQRSYEWLQFLLDTYPDHVVEFSTYAVEWGTVPGYNTVFWEVRAY